MAKSVTFNNNVNAYHDLYAKRKHWLGLGKPIERVDYVNRRFNRLANAAMFLEAKRHKRTKPLKGISHMTQWHRHGFYDMVRLWYQRKRWKRHNTETLNLFRERMDNAPKTPKNRK